MNVRVIELCSETLCIRDAVYRLAHPALGSRPRVFLCAECARARATELAEIGASVVPLERRDQHEHEA